MNQIDQSIRELLDANPIFTTSWARGVLFALLLAAILRILHQSQHTAESKYFDYLAFLLFATISFCLLALLLRLHELWDRVGKLLHELASLPMVSAFDRLPVKLKALFGRFLNPTRPRAEHMRIPLHQLRLLLLQYPTVKQRMQSDFHFDLTEWNHFYFHYYQSRLFDSFESDDRETARARSMLSQASRSAARLLEQVWSQRTVEDAFGHPEKEEESPTFRVCVTACPEVLAWLRMLEDFVAMQTVPYLCQFFTYLRNLKQFAFWASFGLLIPVVSYPFQPQRQLVLLVLTFIGATIAQLIVMYVQMERDEVLSRMAGTTPNRLSLDPAFLTTLLACITPAIAVLLTLFGDLGGLIASWFDPLVRTFK